MRDLPCYRKSHSTELANMSDSRSDPGTLRYIHPEWERPMRGSEVVLRLPGVFASQVARRRIVSGDRGLLSTSSVEQLKVTEGSVAAFMGCAVISLGEPGSEVQGVQPHAPAFAGRLISVHRRCTSIHSSTRLSRCLLTLTGRR